MSAGRFVVFKVAGRLVRRLVDEECRAAGMGNTSANALLPRQTSFTCAGVWGVPLVRPCAVRRRAVESDSAGLRYCSFLHSLSSPPSPPQLAEW